MLKAIQYFSFVFHFANSAMHEVQEFDQLLVVFDLFYFTEEGLHESVGVGRFVDHLH
jgi:hypothetical protein